MKRKTNKKIKEDQAAEGNASSQGGLAHFRGNVLQCRPTRQESACEFDSLRLGPSATPWPESHRFVPLREPVSTEQKQQGTGEKEGEGGSGTKSRAFKACVCEKPIPIRVASASADTTCINISSLDFHTPSAAEEEDDAEAAAAEEEEEEEEIEEEDERATGADGGEGGGGGTEAGAGCAGFAGLFWRCIVLMWDCSSSRGIFSSHPWEAYVQAITWGEKQKTCRIDETPIL